MGMPQVEIRKMAQGEIGRVIEILTCWNMAPVAPSAACPEPEATGLGIGSTFVAVVEGSIVGVSSYILRGDGWAETASLAVDPEWRGKGIGESLQRARLAELRALGMKHVRTEADRPESIAWYLRKFGYRVAGTVPKKHSFGVEQVPHWTVLVLDLDA
jgi:3-keto-5-aminohexanoate cleavage enzyme